MPRRSQPPKPAPKTLSDQFDNQVTEDQIDSHEPASSVSPGPNPASHWEDPDNDGEEVDDNPFNLGDLETQEDDDNNSVTVVPFGNPPPSKPIRSSHLAGHLNYLNITLPDIVSTAFQAWRLDPNHQQIIGADGQLHPYKSLYLDDSNSDSTSEGMTEFLIDVIGRDLELDDHRAPEEKHYDFPGIFGTTFHSLLNEYWQRGLSQLATENSAVTKAAIADRLRLHFPDWTEEQIAFFVMQD